jgi:hypothetical protein
LPLPHEIYRFYNGNYIFKNGQIILPTSGEGQKIVEILHNQEQDKKLNEEQEKRWKEVTCAKNAQEVLKLLVKSPVQRNPMPPEHFRFSNGNYIYLKRGVKNPDTGEIVKQSRVIDPKSEEGEKIEKILKCQLDNIKLNDEQTRRWQTVTKISTMEDTIDYVLNGVES